jgi:hypothetical protein
LEPWHPRKPSHPGAPSTWAVVILRGKEVERLGTVEAPDQREAYRLAIEQFNAAVERQNRLFVTTAKCVSRLKKPFAGLWQPSASLSGGLP